MTAEPELSRTIKDALYECRDEDELNDCAAKYRADVKAMDKDPATKVFAIQILNLKLMRLKDFDRDRHGR